jgi:hypothetical protein
VSVPDALYISALTTPLHKLQQLDRKPRPFHVHDYFTPSCEFVSTWDVMCVSIAGYSWMQTALYVTGLMNCSREWRNKFNKENKLYAFISYQTGTCYNNHRTLQVIWLLISSFFFSHTTKAQYNFYLNCQHCNHHFSGRSHILYADKRQY